MKFFNHKSRMTSFIDQLPKEGQTVHIIITDRDPYKGAKKKRYLTVLILTEYEEKFLTLHLDSVRKDRTECFLKRDFSLNIIDYKIIG
ncbi:MAG: hypothetical protein MJA82_10020 [Clostridia bacterium]|nr:hypothetical protein [Clostridia bacterium]